MKKIPVLWIFLFCGHIIFPQVQEIDSIKALFYQEAEDSIKLDYALSLVDLYPTVNPDSGIYYGNIAESIALIMEDREKYCRALIYLGIAYYRQGNYQKSDSLLVLSYEEAKKIGNSKIMATASHNRGLVYTNQSKFLEALQVYQHALTLYEELGLQKNVTAINVNIGIIYYYQGSIEQALRFHLNALETLDTVDVYDRRRVSVINLNIGGFYSELGNLDSAMLFTKKALDINMQMGNKKGMATCYNNMGEFEIQKNNSFKAREYFLRSIVLKEELKDMRGLMLTSNNMGELELREGRTRKAIEYFEKVKEYAKIVGEMELLSNAYRMLADANDSLGNYRDAYTSHKTYHQYFDSIKQSAGDARLLELQTQYESTRKEQEIALLKREKEFQQLRLKKNRTIVVLLLAGLVLLAFLIAFLFRILNTRRKINHLLNQKNETLNTQKVEIEQQRDQIATHRKALLDSISYARQIQKALLPLQDQFKKHFENYFVYYRPKEIISGDFYWIKANENSLYFAVVDCTGHGVPGALMSMLGISFLNEITGKKILLSPAEILEELRVHVKDTLKQSGSIGEARDGMDVALCMLDQKKNKLIYAGAHIPLWLIRENTIHEYEPTENPIGIYIREERFTNKTIDLQTDDKIYLFTDGFSDQVGGDKVNRYSSVKFKNLLLDLNNEPMQKQGVLLDLKFDEWRNGTTQVDDVTVLGIQFK